MIAWYARRRCNFMQRFIPRSYDGRSLMELSATQGMPVAVTIDAPSNAEAIPPRSRWWGARHGYPGWVLLDFLILVSVLAVTFVASILHSFPKAHTACAVMAGGAAVQIALWLWLIGPGRKAHEQVSRRVARLSGFLNLLLAVAVSWLAPPGDVPAAMIAVPPLIAVAIRYPAKYSISLTIFISLLTLLPLRTLIKSGQAAQVSAAVNAAGLAMAGIVVVLVVSLLTAALRHETARLRSSLRELRETRSRLIAEEKLAAVGRLAAGIAHEIRNPVSMISSSLEMAAQESTPPATRQEMSCIAREEAGRLTKLTDDFLAYARGKPPECREVSLDDFVSYIASLVKARATESGITVQTHCRPGLRATFDEFQMHQAMLNLATNALDATPPGGSIIIGAESDELFVENTGQAIAPETREKLFEPFFTTRPHGTGLGLPITRRIAEAHGGELVLARNEPGHVRFAIYLGPRKRAENL
jgi:signal transduction histidine kinase